MEMTRVKICVAVYTVHAINTYEAVNLQISRPNPSPFLLVLAYTFSK